MKAPNEEIYGKSTQEIMSKSTFSGLQRSRWHYEYLHPLSSCCLPNLRNPAKFELSSSSRSSKVIDLGANEKRIYNFLLVINSNFGRISLRFRDIDAFSSKTDCFHHPNRRSALRYQRNL